MLRVSTEVQFFEKVQVGSLLSPSDYIFIFVLDGFLEVEINGQKTSFRKEHIILISKHHVYTIQHYSDDFKMYLLILDIDQIKEKVNIDFNRYNMYSIINTQKHQNILKLDPLEFSQLKSLVELLKYYLHERTRKSSFEDQIVVSTFSSLIWILYNVLKEKIQFKDNVSSRKQQITIDFLELMTLHFKSERELKFYANRLGISIKYLSICVKEITNTAASVFLANALINEAKNQLLDKSKTVSLIANEFHFSDQYAFGKFFKNHTGLSPRNYRNKNSSFVIDTI